MGLGWVGPRALPRVMTAPEMKILKTTPIPVKFDRQGHSCNFYVGFGPTNIAFCIESQQLNSFRGEEAGRFTRCFSQARLKASSLCNVTSLPLLDITVLKN